MSSRKAAISFKRLLKLTNSTQGQVLPIIEHLQIRSEWRFDKNTWRRKSFYCRQDVDKINLCIEKRSERVKRMNLRGC